MKRQNPGQWDAAVEACSGCHGSQAAWGQSCPRGVMAFEEQAGIREAWGKRTVQEWAASPLISLNKKRIAVFSAVSDSRCCSVSNTQLLCLSKLEPLGLTTDPILGNGKMKPVFEQILKYEVQGARVAVSGSSG